MHFTARARDRQSENPSLPDAPPNLVRAPPLRRPAPAAPREIRVYRTTTDAQPHHRTPIGDLINSGTGKARPSSALISFPACEPTAYRGWMPWLHGSAAFIEVDDWVLPATQLGGRSRTHPHGHGEHELQCYSPDRVYVFHSGDADPRDHIDRFSFTRADYYLYQVQSDDLAADLDQFSNTMQSASCTRARILRRVHEPELPVFDANLTNVAAHGGQIVITLCDSDTSTTPHPGRRIIVRDPRTVQTSNRPTNPRRRPPRRRRHRRTPPTPALSRSDAPASPAGTQRTTAPTNVMFTASH